MSEEVLSLSRDGQVEFRLLTEDRLDDALAVLMETMRTECIAIGVGMWEQEDGSAENMKILFREVVKDGVTVIGIDKPTGNVAAVCFNKIQVRPGENERDPLEVFVERSIKNELCLELLRFLDHVESRVDIYSSYNTTASLEIFYVGTRPGYQGRGIAGEIIRVTVDLCRHLKAGTLRKKPLSGHLTNGEAVPGVVFGVFASDYSQRIVERLGFECLTVVEYRDYVCRGKRMSERIGDGHRTAKLAALRL